MWVNLEHSFEKSLPYVPLLRVQWLRRCLLLTVVAHSPRKSSPYNLLTVFSIIKNPWKLPCESEQVMGCEGELNHKELVTHASNAVMPRLQMSTLLVYKSQKRVISGAMYPFVPQKVCRSSE
jgi:hypothetical protein